MAFSSNENAAVLSSPDTRNRKNALVAVEPLYRWTSPEVSFEEAEAFARELRVPQVIAELLLNRGFDTPEKVDLFLNPEIGHLYSPSAMLGIAAAAERIRQAIARREPVLIYGDYDVDGTVATVLLKTAIDRIAGGESIVRYHIPHRIREGYGMQAGVLADAAAMGVRLVISVDTGIRAFAAAEEAQALGLDLIVTDHHLPDEIGGLPPALAVINPNQPNCPYPNKDLCGAGVAFKLAQALLENSDIPVETVGTKLIPSFLKLLAIATVADAVALTGENRVIVAVGLRELVKPVQPGLRCLMELAQLTGRQPLTATSVAFRLAPRINAAGRMEIASDVVEMFLTRSPERGREIAEKLHRLNEDRRATEQAALDEIEALLAADTSLAEAGAVVLDGHGWHRGVIGILASRVVERTHRPALVLAHEDGEAYGSGRSIPGFHLLDALTAVHSVAPIFTRFGGHAHAVGFSLPSDRVPELRMSLGIYARSAMSTETMLPELHCDASLPLERITPAFVEQLHRFEPFGHSNPEPIFCSGPVRILEIRVLKDKHLRLRLEQGSAAIACLAWSRRIHWPSRLQELGVGQGSMIEAAFRVRENANPDFGNAIELELCDLRPSHTA
ncbi:MAG: single-stranded-DNA-specific exonuclease RecJ [Acidobacteriaceae bacterium]|nr:single-stranded-DNA-specific exonuclease RecJ [Acidobacteriaceae bacterium]